MNDIDRLKKIVNTEITYINPIKLEELSKKFINSYKFPDMKCSFEFPPKSIDVVLEIFFDKDYNKLNFFDIARLLQQIERDMLCLEIGNKSLFSELLQELFNDSKKYIQNMILKIVTKILINKNDHSFRNDLQINMNSREFVFLKLCLKRDFDLIYKEIQSLNFKKVLTDYSINKVLIGLPKQYQDYLVNKISQITLSDDNIECYFNNLLNDDQLEDLYSQIDRLISLIESKQNITNNKFIDFMINKKLGDIESSSSRWQTLAIPDEIQERYKRLKGLFEFQRFVQIAKYLSPDLESSNLSRSGKTSDSDRLRHRSDFWSNYDSRFLSVKMWVSENDYVKMLIDKPVDLSNIKQLQNINNEVCLLEFKESKLVIIEFFKLKDSSKRIYSLVFEGETISLVKNILSKYEFSMEIYNQLEGIANYSINQDYCWQGWLDEFLRERNVFPNEMILQGKNRFKGVHYPYKKEIGLEQTRDEALANDRKIDYNDVIRKR